VQHVPHRDNAAVGGGEERPGQRDVADAAAGHLDPAGEEVQVQASVARHGGGPDLLPDPAAVRDAWQLEFHRGVQPAHERLVHVAAQVGGEHDDAVVLFHLLQQVADLDVGVAVVGVAYLRALAEQGVGLIEEQDGVAGRRLGEDAGQVLLRLADVLADHRGQVDLVQVEAEGVGQHIGGHRLAGTGRAGEQDGQALAHRQLAVEPPRVIDKVAVPDLIVDLTQLGHLVRGQDDVIPGVVRVDRDGELGELTV
jgi:hypothetical protein